MNEPTKFGYRLELLPDGTLRMIDGSDLKTYLALVHERNRGIFQQHDPNEPMPVTILSNAGWEEMKLRAELNTCA